MNTVYHVSTECAPNAKVGGLGDVVYGLARAEKRLGHTVFVILPYYSFLSLETTEVGKTPQFYFHSSEHSLTVHQGRINDITIFLIGKNDPYLFRPQIYGEADDPVRFLYFSLAVSAFLIAREGTIHLHDWPTAAIAPLMKQRKTILTIHNALFQGRIPLELLELAHLSREDFSIPFEPPHHIALLAGGIRFASFVTTVSPTYAQEIQTTQGVGFERLYKERNTIGILNGIDTEYWNPETDPLISPFSPKTLEEGKRKNRELLFSALSIHETDAPLFCSIGRITYQKSPELLVMIAEMVLMMGGHIVILGSPDPDQKHIFEHLKSKLSPRGACVLGYNEILAHLLFGASDFITVPSRFEPCGLTQIIGMRYGVIPIVSPVGGLKDTVEDFHTGGCGIRFTSTEPHSVQNALERAFSLTDEARTTLQKACMKKDFSWEISAKRYLNL